MITTNKNCIIRLSRYKNALNRLQSLGFVKVFSENLADAVGGTSAQVRKDFSIFGISGNKRGGYQIEDLIEKLNFILGKNKVYKVILAGTGNMGSAIINYKGFEKENIQIVAGFDIDPVKYGKKIKNVPIMPLEEMGQYSTENQIKLGIIAVPEVAAQQAFDLMVASGIKGVLNFAPIRLKGPEDVTINNVNLVLELENVIYYVNVMEKEGNPSLLPKMNIGS